ncbi:SDR family NAD(P)-dependent oxidoreductase [Agromyces sp. MMS24-JH15]|uniref:SDR family NAD(P)-dependent oxidoreductase n=1 Tax=Agromyces sp. MMS24-JH15 TaxID=3243765 RepID=UPI003748C193
MLLEEKVAVVYGGGGSVGAAVARAFVEEGAHVFLTGSRRDAVEAVADAIRAGAGAEGDDGADAAAGAVEAAEVDGFDERAIDRHLDHVVERAGRVDISFNAVGIPDADVVGVPLVDLDVDRFLRPIEAYARTTFLTSRLAARRMVGAGSGVILRVTALHSRTGIPLVGGYGPAMAAMESLTRSLSAELAPRGIRVVGLRPQAMPESSTIREAYEPRAAASGLTWAEWEQALAARTHPRRLMTLREFADVAAFVASDRASGLTGTTVNLTMGSLDD